LGNGEFRALREDTHALRLVCKHPDLRAGYANSCVLLRNTPRDSHRESSKAKDHPDWGDRRISPAANIFRLAAYKQA